MARFIPVEPFDLVIFGGTGDLAVRKLLPALYHRDCDGQLGQGSRIIGVSRQVLSDDEYRTQVGQAVQPVIGAGRDKERAWRDFAGRLHHFALDLLDAQHWDQLVDALNRHRDRVRVFYLATPPGLFGPVAEQLARSGLITGQSRIVLEKPVGTDLSSARAINDAVGTAFAEEQIFRIDHYLGKETVQNLLALRFGNAVFEPLWGRGNVDHVQITVAESLGVGTRRDFYDRTGALRDMVQNHLLQLLCLVAMEAPTSLDHEEIRNEKLKVLKALRRIEAADIASTTACGQYTAGAIDDETVPGYLEELGRKDSHTETFVAIKANIDNWRWANVPFYLRTGKRLKAKSSEIVIVFRPVAHSIFPEQAGVIAPNKLTIRLQPDEGVTMSLMTKEPGPGGFKLRALPLDLSFLDAFGLHYPDAYERLLMEVIRGNPALFMRRDEIETAWRWVDWILAAWRDTEFRPEEYVAGSWGPSGADRLIAQGGRRWHDSASG